MKPAKVFENLFDAAYQLYIVDKNKTGESKNHFVTLFNALNHLTNHSIVKINSGVYQERIQIKKSDIKIQVNQLTANVILINEQFPNIVIDLPRKTDKIYFESIKIANICQNHSALSVVNKSYESLKKQNFRGFKLSSSMNCCIYLRKGTLQLDECRLSLASYHNPDNVVPCIIVQQNGVLILNRTEIRGSEGTIGILCKGGEVIMKESVIKDHGGSGILMTGNKTTNLVIKNSSILSCHDGIVLNGPFSGVVDNNIIIGSFSTGIILKGGNRSSILNNELRECQNGIIVQNCTPPIVKNTITFNTQFGIKTFSKNNYICKVSIKFNTISDNEVGGIYISGVLNKSQVIHNELISNGKYGIKVQYQAFPHIFMNKIKKTIGNGVHVCENSTVFLQKNQLNGSLKCNLVLQGPKNINNFIYQNLITNARGDGIFVIYGEKFAIENNEITKNHNGILVATGVLNIQNNEISMNQKNGLMLVEDNNLTIKDNKISNNKEGGLVIRDSSIGDIKGNTFENNKAQIVIENDHESFEEIEQKNKFIGTNYDIRIPKNYSCSLI